MGQVGHWHHVAGATVRPWSYAHPYVNLYGPRNPVTATVAGNFRVTELGTDSDTHHIVLDFGVLPFPVLEGQSLGILPPGTDAQGRAHHARQYSIASPSDGERAGYNNGLLHPFDAAEGLARGEHTIPSVGQNKTPHNRYRR